MNHISYNNVEQKDSPPVSVNTHWIGDALLNMAQMYCNVGNYQQAIEWCGAYMLSNQPNEQLEKILKNIFQRTHSFGIKKQAAKLYRAIVTPA